MAANRGRRFAGCRTEISTFLMTAAIGTGTLVTVTAFHRPHGEVIRIPPALDDRRFHAISGGSLGVVHRQDARLQRLQRVVRGHPGGTRVSCVEGLYA